MAHEYDGRPARVVTLRDVARCAGVDVSTASRALSGRRRVTAAVVSQVQSAAAALGYRPNQAARSLRLARTMTLGIVLSQLNNPGLLEFLEGLDSRADERSYSLMVTVARGDPQHYHTLVRRLFERRVDGLFVATPPDLGDALGPFTRAGTRVIALFTRGACGEELPLLTAHEGEAIRRAVGRLKALGHRRVLYLGIPEAIPGPRLGWLEDAARWADLDLAAQAIPHEEPTTSLQLRLRRALEQPDRATVLFIDYSMAPRLLNAVRSLGLAIPSDLSLVVFGESAWTRELGPALASIRHDILAMGRIAADVMVDRLLGKGGPDIIDAGVAEWIERASVGPAPTTSPSGPTTLPGSGTTESGAPRLS